MVEVAGLLYEYPGLRALDDVGFTIEPGTITALVGPNGAGKTTLLRCLAGIELPLAGSIRINGIDVVDEPRHSHRYVGYLSDFFGLYDELSVRQCLHYVGAANGIGRAALAARIADTAHELGLSERLDQRAGQLSRGLRQRVAIAQAIIHAPTVVLLDEPASGLDPEARYALGELFLALRRRGLTLLVSSHILAELEAYSTHMLILRGGRVIEHRRLAAATSGTRLRARALQGGAALATALARVQDVAHLEHDGDKVEFDYSGGDQARAALLARLVADGLSIVHFAEVGVDLQQSYLDTLARQGNAPATAAHPHES